MTFFATAGFSSRNAPSLSLTIASTMPLTSVLPELGLGLPFELRPRDLHADDRGQALADVVAADGRVLQVLRQVVLRRRRR